MEDFLPNSALEGIGYELGDVELRTTQENSHLREHKHGGPTGPNTRAEYTELLRFITEVAGFTRQNVSDLLQKDEEADKFMYRQRIAKQGNRLVKKYNKNMVAEDGRYALQLEAMNEPPRSSPRRPTPSGTPAIRPTPSGTPAIRPTPSGTTAENLFQLVAEMENNNKEDDLVMILTHIANNSRDTFWGNKQDKLGAIKFAVDLLSPTRITKEEFDNAVERANKVAREDPRFNPNPKPSSNPNPNPNSVTPDSDSDDDSTQEVTKKTMTILLKPMVVSAISMAYWKLMDHNAIAADTKMDALMSRQDYVTHFAFLTAVQIQITNYDHPGRFFTNNHFKVALMQERATITRFKRMRAEARTSDPFYIIDNLRDLGTKYHGE